MEPFLSKIISLLDNFYLATYIIAGSGLGIGLELIGVPFFVDKVWLNIGLCYFSGMISSRVSSLVIEPFCKWAKFIRREPYERFLNAEKLDKTGKLISMSKVCGIYCTMSAVCLIIIVVASIKLLDNICVWKEQIHTIIASLACFILFLCSYSKQNNYLVKRIKYYNGNHDNGRR